ncbi:hypothetical protein EGI20_01640 [Aquitalea sp. S1-19]|nr:hypothetical protein [Aquitalea sp. S1-19]
MNSTASTPTPASTRASALAGQAEIQSESILILAGSGNPIYAVERKLHARTEQADYFRVQLRAHASACGSDWTLLEGEAAQWHNGYHSAEVWVDHASSSISFGPEYGVQVLETLAGKGLPAYLFAQTIIWAKTRYPDYSIRGGLLRAEDAANEEARLRRNGYYATQGFDFEWFDVEQRSGRYFKAKASQLLGVWDSETVRRLDCERLLDTLASQASHCSELEQHLSRANSKKEHATVKLERERMLNLILVGVTCFVLVMGLMAALRV